MNEWKRKQLKDADVEMFLSSLGSKADTAKIVYNTFMRFGSCGFEGYQTSVTIFYKGE